MIDFGSSLALRTLFMLIFMMSLFYVALTGLLYLQQDQMLYQPDIPGRELAATPERIGLDYQTVFLPTDDGERLHGWFIPARQALGTLLFFHGNAGNVSHRLESIAIFHQLGLNQLIIDYRGYGQSSGAPSEQGFYLDAQAAWQHLNVKRTIPSEQIIVFGRSLGGAVAVWLAQQEQPGGLIVESSFTSVPDRAAELYPWLPVRWLAKNRYHSQQRIAQVKAPILIIHSQEDSIIPYHHGQALFAAANEPKEFLQIQGDHNGGFLLHPTNYYKALSDFIRTALGKGGD